MDKARSVALEAAQVSKYIYLNKPMVVVFFHEVNGPRTNGGVQPKIIRGGT